MTQPGSCQGADGKGPAGGWLSSLLCSPWHSAHADPGIRVLMCDTKVSPQLAVYMWGPFGQMLKPQAQGPSAHRQQASLPTAHWPFSHGSSLHGTIRPPAVWGPRQESHELRTAEMGVSQPQ